MPIKGDVKVGDNTFSYGEVSSGTQRAIKIAVSGLAKSDVSYSLKGDGQTKGKKVNIHETDVYKRGPKAFYEMAAEELGKLYNRGDKWPSKAEFDLKKETVYCELD
jgi:hypothetical protein